MLPKNGIEIYKNTPRNSFLEVRKSTLKGDKTVLFCCFSNVKKVLFFNTRCAKTCFLKAKTAFFRKTVFNEVVFLQRRTSFAFCQNFTPKRAPYLIGRQDVVFLFSNPKAKQTQVLPKNEWEICFLFNNFQKV